MGDGWIEGRGLRTHNLICHSLSPVRRKISLAKGGRFSLRRCKEEIGNAIRIDAWFPCIILSSSYHRVSKGRSSNSWN
jgi:hypothetical protein